MAALADSINSMVKWLYSAWDENAATAGGIVFIPCLLVAASLFPNQLVMLNNNVPCYWLFVDAVILCFTVAVIAACIDFAADLYCFFADVHGDSVPMLTGRDYAHEYPQAFNNEIFWALIIRVIGSTFILLVLTSATAFSLIKTVAANSSSQANTSTPVSSVTGSVPPQCDLLSDPVYHFKLYFGFGVVAVVFAVLRLAFVHQSKQRGFDDHHHHHHHHDDDHTQELAVIKTAEDKAADEKAARQKLTGGDEESEEDSDDEKERKRRRREDKRRRRERRERKRREKKDSDEDEDEEAAKDDNESGAN